FAEGEPAVPGLVCIGPEGATGFGQFDMPVVPLEQGGTDLGLQSLDDPTEAGRGDVTGLTGPREVQRLGQMKEEPQFFLVHAPSIPVLQLPEHQVAIFSVYATTPRG